MAELGDKLLHYLNRDEKGFDTIDVSKELNVDHQKVVGAVKSLQSLGNVYPYYRPLLCCLLRHRRFERCLITK